MIAYATHFATPTAEPGSSVDVWQRTESACIRALDALPAGLEAALDSKVVLATGMTGFFGLWTLASVQVLRSRGCSVRVRVVSSDPERFLREHAMWRHAEHIEWVCGDIREVKANQVAGFDYGLHMAARSDARTNAMDLQAMAASIICGSRVMARLCASVRAPLLMVSSGAVYGMRSLAAAPLTEDDVLLREISDARQVYGEAKLSAEIEVQEEPGLSWTISRPFSFLGPHLPLTTHFAAGNFLRDAAQGKAIEIKGDGSPIRSYMHPADAAAWHLWLMAHGPRGEAVNVGCQDAVSLRELAEEIAAAAMAPQPDVLGSAAAAANSYVPCTRRAQEIGLKLSVQRRDAIKESLSWLMMNHAAWGSCSTSASEAPSARVWDH